MGEVGLGSSKRMPDLLRKNILLAFPMRLHLCAERETQQERRQISIFEQNIGNGRQHQAIRS